MGKKVDKEGSRWTARGIEQQDGVGRPCMWSAVTGKGATRPHALSRASTCVAVCRWGCHRRVDRPRAPRNLWFPVGEELLGKSPATVATAAAAARRRSGDGGFQEEKKVIGMKHDH